MATPKRITNSQPKRNGAAVAKSVLISDDDGQSRSALRHIFEFLTHKVYEASSGQAGIDSFRKNPTDIVVIDILLPEKDGPETIW